MIETAVATSHEAIAASTAAETAQRAGDPAAANAAYARELSALADSPAAGTATPPGTQVATTYDSHTPHNGSAGHARIASYLTGTSVTVEPWSGDDTAAAFGVMARWNGWNNGPGAADLRSR